MTNYNIGVEPLSYWDYVIQIFQPFYLTQTD